VFSVSDTGSGIPAGIQEKIFDPFFTTKPVGQGTGLGLSTVLKIVEAHKGFVTVRSEDGKGATFRVHLPAAGTAPAAKRPPERFATRDERGAGTVLVVDDEKSIVQLVKGALESAGYRVLTASNGAEALHLFGERREEIGVVLLDYFMPVLDGPETVRALRRISDSVRIVYISGAESVVMGDRQEGVQGVLLKPFTLESLLRGVRGERG
jgi:CheY-like chemotaxis protein